jgi:hypothetical protein
MLTLSPDERFLLVGCSLDELPGANPDGSPIVWVKRNEKPHSIFANAPDPDGLAVFPVDEHGGLCEPMFQDAGASSPWCTMFLKNRRNQFVIGFASADGLSLAPDRLYKQIQVWGRARGCAGWRSLPMISCYSQP